MSEESKTAPAASTVFKTIQARKDGGLEDRAYAVGKRDSYYKSPYFPAPRLPGDEEDAKEEPPKKKSRKTHRGRRGKGAKNRASDKARKSMIRSVKWLRSWERRNRYCLADSRVHISPGLAAGYRTMLGDYETLGNSTAVAEFYATHNGEHSWIEVSERPNVSNPTGEPGKGKGVFAKRDLLPGTMLCPYVGKTYDKRCDPERGCHYDMKVGENYYVCAHDLPYDIGYLYFVEPADRPHGYLDVTQVGCPAPPNYGRYFNSLSKAQQDEGRKFNVTFEGEETGLHVIWLETSDFVKAGDELLVDYGAEFAV